MGHGLSKLVSCGKDNEFKDYDEKSKRRTKIWGVTKVERKLLSGDPSYRKPLVEKPDIRKIYGNILDGQSYIRREAEKYQIREFCDKSQDLIGSSSPLLTKLESVYGNNDQEPMDGTTITLEQYRKAFEKVRINSILA